MGKKNNWKGRVSLPEFHAIKKNLIETGEMDAVIISGSMTPVLGVDEPVKIKPIPDAAKLKKFDIVIFWQLDRLISHYVVCRSRIPGSTSEGTFITRGLNSAGEDLPVAESLFLGVVSDKKIPWHVRFIQTIRLIR